jgi:hypothetical protein
MSSNGRKNKKKIKSEEQYESTFKHTMTRRRKRNGTEQKDRKANRENVIVLLKRNRKGNEITAGEKKNTPQDKERRTLSKHTRDRRRRKRTEQNRTER